MSTREHLAVLVAGGGERFRRRDGDRSAMVIAAATGWSRTPTTRRV